jgi:small subunit ribosomal protein S20
MPIIKSAKKANEASKRKHVFNLRRKRDLKATIKEVKDFVAEGKIKEAFEILPKAYKAIDKAAKRGVIKSNTADRKKSRLTKFIESNKDKKPTVKKKK